jgi:class 3 adenylate cyclase
VKVSARLKNYLVQALAQSMPVELMEQLAAQVLPDYDLRRQSGFPPSIPIPQRDAALQVVSDVISQGQLRSFAEVLIDVDRNGIMGRTVSISQLPKIITEIENLGLVFKEEYGLFMEGIPALRSRSWGVLREGQVYEFSFLRMDIADSTRLVRKYPKPEVLKAYGDLHSQFAGIVERREGRVWHWEGDGGIAAFYFGAKNVQATLAGMEMLLELFMYNLFRRPLSGDLHLRLAVHTGSCPYLNNFEQVRSDTLRRLEQIESQFTSSDSLMISPGVYSDMGTKLESFFQPVQISRRHFLYKYQLGWE